MGKAMNRSIGNVLFGAFGAVAAGTAAGAAEDGRPVRSTTPEDLAIMLAYARKVVFVPGYGLAVAQAQHDVRALAEVLESKGIDVQYGIHPVAGRMPGHMNVLLAEADVPYDQLKEMDEINPELPQTDVVVILGANDVVNPAARTDLEPDLRHADHRGRPGCERRSGQAVAQPRLREHRQSPLLRPQDVDAVRRREEGARGRRRGCQAL